MSLLAAICVLVTLVESLSVTADQWTLTWQDNFSGTTLDKRWTAWSNKTHGNTERELYLDTPEAVSVKNGKLHLTAYELKRPTLGPNGKMYKIASGWVDTSTEFSKHPQNPNGFSQLYGRWEINAKLPVGHLWPAIWLMPNYGICWPVGGEVDIMEPDIWGKKVHPPYQIHGTYHWSPQNCGDNHSAPGVYRPGLNFTQEFHTYGVEWTPDYLTYEVDYHKYHKISRGDTGDHLPKHPMYLILNNAIAPFESPKNLPQSFEVDWVKIYNKKF